MAYQPHPFTVPTNHYDEINRYLSQATALNYVLWTRKDNPEAICPAFWVMEDLLKNISAEVENMRRFYEENRSDEDGQ